MVSKASDDFPEPLTPVMMMSWPSGSARSMFFRLCVRAPRTTISLAGAATGSAILRKIFLEAQTLHASARWHDLQQVERCPQRGLEEGRTYPNGRATRVECCGWLKKDGLQQVIEHYGYTGVIVGVRRDEDATRAKERYFSPRNANMEWNASDQPPEFWDQFKTDFAPGTHIRIHPLLHWTELNVWEYIEREKMPVIPLYFDDGTGHRFRSLGCAPCTFPIQSTAKTVSEIVAELKATKVPERAGRAQDQESEDAFEKLRRDGYM